MSEKERVESIAWRANTQTQEPSRRF